MAERVQADRGWDLFDEALSAPIEELEFDLRGCADAPWSDFFLNPRRLRGSDFLMRWNQGAWTERIVIEAVNAMSEFYAIPYGPSSVAPDDDIQAHERYFERLEQAGLSQLKRPDILIFRKSDIPEVDRAVKNIGGELDLPFHSETEPDMQALLSKSILAVECENSLWVARQMRNYGEALRPMRRLGGKLGLPKNAILPTVILKEEDRERLFAWQNGTGIDIHIWHVFFDLAFGLSLDRADSLISEGLIEPTRQTFQAPGGATSSKDIYKFYYHYAYPLGDIVQEPNLIADSVTDRNGHILPFVKFEGGRLRITSETLQMLQRSAIE